MRPIWAAGLFPASQPAQLVAAPITKPVRTRTELGMLPSSTRAERTMARSPSSDVLPALEAGAWAAFVPHDIQWGHERADEPVGHPRYRRLRSIADLPGWIDEIEQAGGSG